MTDSLGAKEYVAGLVGGISGPWPALFPAVCICCRCVSFAFATGTSWGTFGILIPIVVSTFSGTNHTMMIISISAAWRVRYAATTVHRFRIQRLWHRRVTVQPYQPCIDTAAVCVGCSSCFMYYIHYCRLCTESGSAVNHWYCAYGWHAFWHKSI